MVSVGCPCGDPRAQLEIEAWCSNEGLGMRDTLGRNSLRNTRWSHGRGRNHENRENKERVGTTLGNNRKRACKG